MNDLIEFDSKRQVFHLHNRNISYIFSVEEGGTLCHLYFGRRVQKYHGELKYQGLTAAFQAIFPDRLTGRSPVTHCRKSTAERVRWTIIHLQRLFVRKTAQML